MLIIDRLQRRFMHADPAGGGGDPAGGDPAGEGGDPAGGGGDPAGGVMSGATAWGWDKDQPGEGDRPEWLAPKFKTVADQAKNYSELEKQQGKFGNYFGAPEGDYKLTLPEGVQGEFDTDSPLLKAVTAQAKEMGISQAGFEKLLHSYVENDANLVANQEAQLAQVTAELGANGEAFIADTFSKLKTAIGDEAAAALDSVVGSAAAVRALDKLLGSEAVLPGDGGDTNTGQLGKEELDAKRFAVYPADHPKAGKVKYMEDPKYRAEIDALYARAYPGKDQQEVG